MLPELSKYTGQNPAGFYLSEKLNGVRTLWNGVEFISKNGNAFAVPNELKLNMPRTPLDGELCAAGNLGRIAGLCRRKTPAAVEEWQGVTFQVFDIKEKTLNFRERLELLTNSSLSPFCRKVSQTICHGFGHLRAEYDRIKAENGEGIVLKHPDNMYHVVRNETAMKLKYDDDFEVNGWTVSAATGERIICRDYE